MGFLWLLIKIIFSAIVIFALLHTLVTHLLLWVELRLNALQKGDPVEIPLPVLIKSFAIEFCCIVLKCVLYPFYNWSSQTSASPIKTTAYPILLVHGYLNNQTDWLWFTRELKKNESLGPVFSLNLTPPFGSIEELARAVQRKIEEIHTKTGSSKIILVGHSMGGLVCSYCSENLAKPDEVVMVITLGTCFRGTRLAALGYGKNAIEMAPGSSFLGDLREKMQKSKIPYFSIASKIDNMIIPWHSALLDDAKDENSFILADHGHLRLLISKPIVEQVSKWILSKA